MRRTGARSWPALRRLRGHGRSGARTRVLVVDDDEVIRKLIAVHLVAAGFAVDCASGGENALERAAQVRPAVIILDAGMPRPDGWEVAARLRGDPVTASAGVVILAERTADCGPGGRRTGIDACIAKPFDPGELLDVVHRLAAGRPGG